VVESEPRTERKTTRWDRFLGARIRYLTVREFFHKRLYERLPPHTGWAHALGSLALLTFVSQFVTGILLLLYYRPSVKEDHESIQYITGEVCFGWLFRQVHACGAAVMMIAVILHMVRTFLMGSFKRPREIIWIIGVMHFVVTMLFGFTGYLLPWNQLSYWATTVGTEVMGAVPFIGEDLKSVLLGGPASVPAPRGYRGRRDRNPPGDLLRDSGTLLGDHDHHRGAAV
jgi:quinol-cytochrome oxidoreductase complex cytochrome b subunit